MFSISSTYSFLFSQTLSSIPLQTRKQSLRAQLKCPTIFFSPVSIVILLGNFMFLSQPLNSCVSLFFFLANLHQSAYGFPCYFHELPLQLIAGVLFCVCVSTLLIVTVVFFSLAWPKIVRGWGGGLDIFSPKHCDL